MSGERMVEAAGFLWPKHTRIEDAVGVSIFEGAERPTPASHVKMEDRFVSRHDPNLLDGTLEKAIGPPQSNVDDVFA